MIGRAPSGVLPIVVSLRGRKNSIYLLQKDFARPEKISASPWVALGLPRGCLIEGGDFSLIGFRPPRFSGFGFRTRRESLVERAPNTEGINNLCF